MPVMAKNDIPALPTRARILSPREREPSCRARAMPAGTEAETGRCYKMKEV